MPRNIKDANLIVTKALPDGAASTLTDGIDLENSSRGDFVAGGEFVINAPVLTTTEAPDTKTFTYELQHDTDPAFGSAVSFHKSLIIQTGAGGAGDAAVEKRVGIPSNAPRYWRLKCTGVATGLGSTKSMTLAVAF